MAQTYRFPFVGTMILDHDPSKMERPGINSQIIFCKHVELRRDNRTFARVNRERIAKSGEGKQTNVAKVSEKNRLCCLLFALASHYLKKNASNQKYRYHCSR